MQYNPDEMKAKYFDPLRNTLELHDLAEENGEGFTTVSGSSGNCTVFFESDRGLFLFALGEKDSSRALCDVETLSRRFSPVRKMSGGTQRLSLKEQSELIIGNWAVLQELFSTDGLSELKEWLSQVQAELTEQYAGES